MGKKALLTIGGLTAIATLLVISRQRILVMAAYDSDQRGADFICDGLDDQVQIQAALDELRVLGKGRLLFRAGHYYLRPTPSMIYFLYTPGGVTFEGEGIDETFIYLTDSSSHGGIETDGWSWNNPYLVPPITFRNMTIDCGSQQGFLHSDGGTYFYLLAMTTELELDGVRLVAHNSDIVTTRMFLWHCRDLEFVGSQFDGVNMWAFSNPLDIELNPYLLTNRTCTVNRCLFTNTSAHHMALGGAMKNFTVVDSDFLNCGWVAVDASFSPHARVLRNRIIDSMYTAIYSEGGFDVQIKENTIHNITPNETGWGFGVHTADILHMRLGGKVAIEDNEIDGCGIGICSRGVPDVAIRRNTVKNTWSHAVYLTWLGDNNEFYKGIPSYADECRVERNKLVSFGTHNRWSRGIILANINHNVVEGNEIDGMDNPNADIGILERRDEGEDLRDGCPDYNTIRSNPIGGVSRDIVYCGEHTIVEE